MRGSGADLAVAVTGIAGPTGGTLEKPIGLVYFALVSTNGKMEVTERKLLPVRETFKHMASQIALDLVRRALV